VLEARGRLDGGDDLPRDAELGEAAERGLLVRPEVAHRLVETDHPFLDEVVAVAARQEVRARLEPDEAGVPPHEPVERLLASVPSLEDELQILKLSLSFLSGFRCCGGADGHRDTPVCSASLSGSPDQTQTSAFGQVSP